jgi:hypothetical protein
VPDLDSILARRLRSKSAPQLLGLQRGQLLANGGEAQLRSFFLQRESRLPLPILTRPAAALSISFAHTATFGTLLSSARDVCFRL